MIYFELFYFAFVKTHIPILLRILLKKHTLFFINTLTSGLNAIKEEKIKKKRI